MQSIDLALSPQGRLKVGEKRLPTLYEDTAASNPATSRLAFLPGWCLDAFEVVFSLRGLGWEFGKGVIVPKDSRPPQRDLFIKATLVSFIKNYFIVDFIIALLQLMPGIGSTTGGSMFYTSLPLAHRYIVSTFILMISGGAMTAGFEALYSLGTLIGVGILNQPPAAWPPLTSNPFAADSLGDFWSKRWHQTLRRTFIVMGGIPAGWIAGRPGMVIGTFIASGLIHELGAYSIGRGIDHTVTLFFTIQGVAVALEGLWRSVTGRRVGGWPGRIWAYALMVPLGEICCESFLSA